MDLLPKRECLFGYTEEQLKECLGDEYDEFIRWMIGQTFMKCDHKKCEMTSTEEISGENVYYEYDIIKFLTSPNTIHD